MYSTFHMPSSSFIALPSHETHQTLAVHSKRHGLPSQVMGGKQPEDVQHLGTPVTIVAQAQLGAGLDTQELNLR